MIGFDQFDFVEKKTLGVTLVEDGGHQYYAKDREEARSVTDAEGFLLAAMACNRRVLEIGTGTGLSALYMAKTAKTVTTVDNSVWVQRHIFLPSNVWKVTGLDDLGASAFEMVFIDGDHGEESVRHDIDACLPLAKSNALFVFHDMTMPQVKATVESYNWVKQIRFPTAGHLTACWRAPEFMW